MAKALTKQEFALYSLLYLKFKGKEFDLNSVRWYFSKPMLKKLIFNLTEAGWINKVRKGVYACVNPQNAIVKLFEPKVEEALKSSNLAYCFTKATAAEIWSDETCIQRSWEYSPFFIKVLKKDLKKWKNYLKSKNVSFFVANPSNIIGGFVVLVPVALIKIDVHNGKPVEPLQETIKFCEANKDSFEYVLAYFSDKYKKKTSASEEMLLKASEAL